MTEGLKALQIMEGRIELTKWTEKGHTKSRDEGDEIIGRTKSMDESKGQVLFVG